MVHGLIEGRVEKESPPAAPFEDEVIIQHLLNELKGRMFNSPQVELSGEFLIGYLSDKRLRVLSPIKVKIATEEDQIVVEAVELNEFGFGKNTSESILDLQRAIAELYFTLEKEQTRLGPDLQRVWNILQQKILKK